MVIQFSQVNKVPQKHINIDMLLEIRMTKLYLIYFNSTIRRIALSFLKLIICGKKVIGHMQVLLDLCEPWARSLHTLEYWNRVHSLHISMVTEYQRERGLYCLSLSSLVSEMVPLSHQLFASIHSIPDFPCLDNFHDHYPHAKSFSGYHCTHLNYFSIDEHKEKMV